MKKLSLGLIIIVVLISCNSSKPPLTTTKPNFELEVDVVANVSKIDSIADYYLVYIDNGKQSFKIVSSKNTEVPLNATKIKINETYKFKIKQITDRRIGAVNNQLQPVNYLDIMRCLNFNRTEICTESAFELAKSSNLKGLHLLLNQ
uniref:hypothetical protein n=1 Tax=Flavobacterium sp. TaxID=239 RepID=UPI00404A4E1B